MRVEVLGAGSWAGRGRDCWERVVSRMPSAGPFLSTVWVDSWMGVFAAQLKTVQLIVVDDSGVVVGTCLLTPRVRRWAVLAHVRLHLNTDGENALDSVVVEHNAVPAVAGWDHTVAQAIARQVVAMRADEFRVAGAGESEVARLRQAFVGWEADTEWHDAPFVDLIQLRASHRTHLDVLSRNTREQLRRSIARYQQRGPIRVELARSIDEAEVMFAEMVRLHEARWVAAGHSGAFASVRRREFHRAFLRDGVPSGHAHMLRVSSGGETVAVLYYLVANGRVSFYQSGLQHDDDKHLKPGMTAHHLAIQFYLEQGYAEYDFLSSAPGEGRYKASLSNSSRPLASLTLLRPGWRGRYFRSVRRLRDALRHALRRGARGEAA